MSVYGTAAARDRHGWFLGLTGLQLVLLLAAATPAWLAMAVGRWATLLVLVPGWIVSAALITVPVRGWSAAQWAGVLARQAVGTATGWATWRSAAASGAVDDPDHADLPGILTGIRLYDGPPLPGRLDRPALIQDLSSRTWAATARLTHPGIGMAGQVDRDQMAAGLAELLEAASTGGQIHHLALQVRTVPEDAADRDEWVSRHRRADEPPLSAQLHDTLDQTLIGAALRTEAFLTVVVDEHTLARDARRAGRLAGHGVAGRARVLHCLLGEVEARLLGGIGCTAVRWLDAPGLAAAVRLGFEPGDATALANAALAHRRHRAVAAGVPAAAAGPTLATPTPRRYDHGEWTSVSATILLPRKGAVLGALARTLVPSTVGERRALTVFYRPIGHTQADRRTGRDEMSAAMSAELRRRVGRIERAGERRATQRVHETDEKLQRGRALVQVTAAASVTVPRDDDTHDHGRRLDADIRLCGFVPLLLDGCHDAGFAAATIPLGVGLPTRRRG